MKKINYTKIYHLLLSLLFCVSLYSQEDEKHILYKTADYNFPYQINSADKKWELPKKLIEISGLSYIDESRLACVQDEKGHIYIYNLKTAEIEQKIEFEEDGDYEGIVLVENDAWILKSNGTLFRVKEYLSEKDRKTNKYTTELSRKNDAEGLTYDPQTNSLLIACKGHPFLDKKAGKEFKAIYSFSLETKKLDINPVFLIIMDSIKHYKNYNTMTHLGVELLAYFDESKGDVSFQPSGIAIHPLTGNIYIIGAVGNLLMVFSREEELLTMIKLKSKKFFQPEGICFSPGGTLFISNEGDEKKSNILKFTITQLLKP